MGGKTWVRSHEGEGSSFHFTIIADAAEGPERDFLRQKDACLDSSSVLFVDDSAVMGDLLTRHTSQWGMQVQTARSAPKALEKLWAGGEFDLVLIDPLGLTSAGRQWVSDMRNICASKQIPIVTLSARSNDDRTMQQELGAIASLAKPVRPELLLEAMRSAVQPLLRTFNPDLKSARPAKSRAAGMDAYVSKPADVGELREVLARVPVLAEKTA